MTNTVYDVAIIGAGPAGLAAAEQILKYGGQVIILDEQPRAGGQIMRQPPKEFKVKGWLRGSIYTDTKNLLHRVEAHPKVNWRMSAYVSGIIPLEENGHQVWFQDATGLNSLRTKKIILCSGCYERPLAFPGATTPGVMGTGAIQTFLKSQQILVGDRFVFAGTHPLQLIVAEQIIKAGGKIEAVAFAQPLSHCLAILKQPRIILSHWRVIVAASIWRIKLAGVPLLFGCAIKNVNEGEHLNTVTLQSVNASGKAMTNRPTRQYKVDRLGLCYGFQVSSELARQAGANSFWSDNRGGWLISHSEWMESSLAGLFVAGELTGMAGADASREEGYIAGNGCLLSLGLISCNVAKQTIRQARKKLKKYNSFAQALAQLSKLPEHLSETVMTDNSLLCRCENITCGTVKKALENNPHSLSANSVKLLTRTGMGLCQGRLCYANTASLIATTRNCHIEDIGPYHAQWPVKPILISKTPKKRRQ
ncbi:MAG: FAD-dependent oxidoreductase [Deltaproteobacteria bacterium]|nr:FAD-dependent oxidoreductase [Deltaproteobacteria bacterium]